MVITHTISNSVSHRNGPVFTSKTDIVLRIAPLAAYYPLVVLAEDGNFSAEFVVVEDQVAFCGTLGVTEVMK